MNYRDADLVLTLLTEKAGKLSALARAARKSRRRFGGALGSLQISQVSLRRGRGGELWTLATATPEELFPELAADMVALAHSSYGTEIVRELVAAEVEEQAVFHLLCELFRELSTGGSHPPLLRSFELGLLRHLGIEPVLDVCAACGDDDLVHGAVFDPSRGGAVCRSCAAHSVSVGVKPLEPAVRDYLSRCAQVTTLGDARGILADDGGALGGRALLMALVQSHVGRPLKSLEFARKLR